MGCVRCDATFFVIRINCHVYIQTSPQFDKIFQNGYCCEKNVQIQYYHKDEKGEGVRVDVLFIVILIFLLNLIHSWFQ